MVVATTVVGVLGCGGENAQTEPVTAVRRGAPVSSATSSSSPIPVETTAEPSSTAGRAVAATSPALDEPPPAVVVVSQSGRPAVDPYTYSTAMEHADGTAVPASGPAVVVEGTTLQLVYPPPGWTFVAVADEQPGGTRVSLKITVIDEHRFDVAAAAPGIYDVWVEGSGSPPDVRTAGFVFRWIVPQG
jgi:hypothetical protein